MGAYAKNAVQRHVDKLGIATWNVRSLLKPGKLMNVIMEAKRCRIDIMGMSEVRWPGTDRISSNGYEMIYSGGDKGEHGVGILIKKELSERVTEIIPISNRALAIVINNQPKPISIVQVYAPTTEHDDNEIEAFYEEIEKVMKKLRLDGPLFVMGDFNAKVGKGIAGNSVGAYGLGQRNDRGDRLIEYADKNRLVACNTIFQQHHRRLYTWKSPGDQVRNQIDYIFVNHRYKNAVVNCHTYPSADCNTDHVLLRAECRIRLKKLNRTKNSRNRINISPLKNRRHADNFSKKLQEKTDQIEGAENVENMWQKWKTAILDTADETLEKGTKAGKRQVWMTSEIMDLIDRRRQIKDRSSSDYKGLNKEISRRCKQAKIAWYEERCQNIEKLEEKGKTKEVHQEIKWLMKQQKKRRTKIMVIEDGGKLLCSQEEVEKAWLEYVKKLYGDNTRSATPPDVNSANNAPAITMSELEYALKVAKRNKAVGPDGIPVEMLKCLSQKSKEKLLQMLNKMYQTGEMPEDFQLSSFVPIPKKRNARKLTEFRTISLMSHTLKLLLAIINRRIERKIDEHMSETQYGFMAHKGTRDAIVLFKMLVQRALAVNRSIYVCYIDYEKAFDRVQHEKLIDALRRSNIDKEDIQIVRNLYWQQKAKLITSSNTSDQTCSVEKGVRQGCPLSPRLFNLYTDEISRHRTIENAGFRVNGKKISNISYADDKVMIAETPQQLQRMVYRLELESEKYGMKINAMKTKIMRIGRDQSTRPLKILVKGTQLEEVQVYRYLGSLISSDGRDDQEINTRIGMARSAFNNMERVLRDRKMEIGLRLRILMCYVWSVARYASETWILSRTAQKKIEAFEMWCYRRMHRIKWTEKISNRIVLQRTGLQQTILLSRILEGKKKFLQAKLEGDEMFRTVVQGKITGKAPRGRRRLTMLHGIEK